MKKLLILLLSALSMMAYAQTDVKKVAILETVDKMGNVPYGVLLQVRSSLTYAISSNAGYEGYDRVDMAAITGEQNFQRTGMVSDEQIKRLGEMTGAAYVLIAEAAIYDDQNIIIAAKILDVETGGVMSSTPPAVAPKDPMKMAEACIRCSQTLVGGKMPTRTTTTTYSQTGYASSTTSQTYLEQQYSKGLDYYKAEDYIEAINIWKPLAEQGHADAQYNLAVCYYNGTGVVQDYYAAVSWYRKAAEQGQANAQSRLGTCYGTGTGVAQDYYAAVSWFRKAAEQGLANAQYNLALCYYNGYGVTQDYYAAVSWFRKSAEQGDVDAQSWLGTCYGTGTGVAQDYYAAVSWFRKAAEQGHADAQKNLGLCYDNGYGVAQDYYAAVSWYRKAAEQGQANAQYNLGLCYYNGYGVTQDSYAAESWFRKAAEQGLTEAKEVLSRLKNK